MVKAGNDALGLLAQQKRLPVDFLHQLHVRNVGVNRICIPYGRRDGRSCARSRIRYGEGEQRFAWGAATRISDGEDGGYVTLPDGRVQVERLEIIPYGLWRLDTEPYRQYCILGEGESDAWACWYHGIPYLGLPGAQSHRCLRAEHVAEIPKLLLWREPGEAGQQFVENLNDHLRNRLDYRGALHVLKIDGLKDPSDLHVEDPKRFVERLEAAMREAPPLPRPPAPLPASPRRTLLDPQQAGRYVLSELIVRDLGPPVKAGQWRCPFHDDRGRPNLGVYSKDGKQRFKCHRCGAGGDAIEWLQRMHNLSFREACEHLGLDLADEPPAGVDISHLLEAVGPRETPDSPPEPEVDLDEWRQQMVAARLASVGKPGVYLDRSETGAGKTFADLQLCQAAGTSLTVLPSHVNCQETETLFREHGLEAAAFPALDKGTCQNLVEAQKAQEYGLGVRAVVCPACPFKDECVYLSLMDRAEQAAHRIATHQRAALTIEELARGRELLCIHEDAATILRPTLGADEGFHDVAVLAANVPREALLVDDDARWFYHQMEKFCDLLADTVRGTRKTTPVDFQPTARPPREYQKHLWLTMQTQAIDVLPRALQLVLAVLARGAKPYVQVDRDAAGNLMRTIVAVSQVQLGTQRVIWFADATASRYELECMIGQPVQDRTPRGRLKLQHPVLLVPRDIKQGTSPKTVLNALRGVLYALPQYRRIGIIGHRRHLPLLQRLEEPLRQRIERTSYFRSGDTRGSNDWYQTCDLVITLGTPRVPVSAVRHRLLQLGEHAAASLPDGDWQPCAWTGVTASGKRRQIRTSQYTVPPWRQACEFLVLAELRQCIGRGRGILDAGVPVLVLTNEPLPFRLLDSDVFPINEVESRILQCLGAGRGPNWGETLIDIYKSFTPILRPGEIAKACGVSVTHVYDRLKSLRSRRLVQHHTHPRGWSLSAQPAIELEPPATVDGEPSCCEGQCSLGTPKNERTCAVAM